MKRQASFRIRKRDGRVEWLRSSKLARSIARALMAAESVLDERATQVAFAVDDPGGGLTAEFKEDWRAIDLATAVLTGLCGEAGVADGEVPMWTSERVAQAAQRVLSANGYAAAATAYARARNLQTRRRGVLEATMLSARPVNSQNVADGEDAPRRVSDCPSDPRTV